MSDDYTTSNLHLPPGFIIGIGTISQRAFRDQPQKISEASHSKAPNTMARCITKFPSTAAITQKCATGTT
eukprot:scaffold12965_cov117-Skeletonema_dohrnii-CCMP3373.AAC.3